MTEPIDIDEVNAMDANAFEAAFGGLAEHSPWVAREAETARPFAARDAMTLNVSAPTTNALARTKRTNPLDRFVSSIPNPHTPTGTRPGPSVEA